MHSRYQYTVTAMQSQAHCRRWRGWLQFARHVQLAAKAYRMCALRKNFIVVLPHNWAMWQWYQKMEQACFLLHLHVFSYLWALWTTDMHRGIEMNFFLHIDLTKYCSWLSLKVKFCLQEHVHTGSKVLSTYKNDGIASYNAAIHVGAKCCWVVQHSSGKNMLKKTTLQRLL